MATNRRKIAVVTGLDSELIRQARMLGRHSTEEDAVHAALLDYILHRKQTIVSTSVRQSAREPAKTLKLPRRRS